MRRIGESTSRPPDVHDLEQRILVLAPLTNDAVLTAQFLENAGHRALVCTDAASFFTEARRGCGAWLVAEEALNENAAEHFRQWLGEQPSWSEVPIILVTTGGREVSAARRRLFSSLDGNVTFLERPFRPGTLVSTFEVAMRSRARQYQVRDLLEQTRRDAEALRGADQRKNEFLAMLAHELRNPLSSVAHAARLLTEGADSAERRWAAEVISRQSGQLARLVDDLLDVSRITRGQIELRRRLCDAADSISRACETVAPLIASRDHVLMAEFHPGELWLDADPTRVEQVVVNLLANAAKYTRPHGHIWLTAQVEDGRVVIRIRDSGIGISPEKIPDMFELFVQGERSAARSEGGLGIGLTVVRGLCEMHGGSIAAESEGRDRGSTFTIRLPRAQPPASTATSADDIGEKATAATARARILLVDDNADTAQGLARLLRRRGYLVEVAHDGPAALDVAHSFAPTVVLLDIGLPGMDGYEVARRLRHDAPSHTALLVALTGYGQEEDRARAQASGFDHHLVKPVDFEHLESLLAQPSGTASR